MSNLITLENHKLSDLCKTGGLQIIYDQSFAAVRTEITDVTTPAGRKRIRSLAAKVASSKVLFEKACKAHIANEELAIIAAKTEIKTFVKSMDDLRDSTKQPVIEIEAYNAAEEEAYAELIQRQEDAEKAAQNALYEAQALLFSHLEAIIQNMEFDALKLPKDIARMHCENKGQVFDFASWDYKEKQVPVILDACVGHGPDLSFLDVSVADEPHFKMPSKPVAVVDDIDYQRLAAEEALEEVIGWYQASDVLDAIIANKIPGVTYE